MLRVHFGAMGSSTLAHLWVCGLPKGSVRALVEEVVALVWEKLCSGSFPDSWLCHVQSSSGGPPALGEAFPLFSKTHIGVHYGCCMPHSGLHCVAGRVRVSVARDECDL